MKTYSIVLLPGDGIGPEVTAVARAAMESVTALSGFRVKFSEHAFGGASIDQFGEPLTGETLKACQASDAIFLGAVGGPKWDQAPSRPEAGLLGLRKALQVYANLRPVSVHPALAGKSPLRAELVAGVDMLIVRELTGGIYFGARQKREGYASDECAYSRAEIERVAHIAFRQARLRRGRLMSVDKANVLETSRLWRSVVSEMGARTYPDIELDHMYVDAAAMHLLRDPASFDVVLTENMFGDILSDEASMLPGSIGLLGSASLGDTRPAIESVAQLFEAGLGEIEAAARLRAAVSAMHEAGEWTGDLGGTLTCSKAGICLIEHLERQPAMAAG